MREHKYRAWSEKNKMMYYSHRPDGSDNPLWSWDVVFREDWHDGRGPGDNWAIKMECSGLKDKHKTEIYEGDLLRAFGAIIGVIWHNGSFGYIASRHTGFIAFSANQHLAINGGVCEKLEVVGNICENPELVK